MPAYRHVWFTTGIDSLGYRINQLARNTEVAHFHLAGAVYQYIRWFYVSMNDVQFRVQVMQGVNNL